MIIVELFTLTSIINVFNRKYKKIFTIIQILIKVFLKNLTFCNNAVWQKTLSLPANHTYNTMKAIYTIFAFILTITATQAQTQNITKKQAIEDIDSLMYTISEVHPNMFGNVGMSTLFKSVAKVKEELPDVEVSQDEALDTAIKLIKVDL